MSIERCGLVVSCTEWWYSTFHHPTERPMLQLPNWLRCGECVTALQALRFPSQAPNAVRRVPMSSQSTHELGDVCAPSIKNDAHW